RQDLLVVGVGGGRRDDHDGQRAAGRQAQGTGTGAQRRFIERGAVQEVLQQLALGLQLEAERAVTQQPTDGQRVGGVREHRRHLLHRVAVQHPAGYHEAAPALAARPDRRRQPPFGSARRGLYGGGNLARPGGPVLQQRRGRVACERQRPVPQVLQTTGSPVSAAASASTRL